MAGIGSSIFYITNLSKLIYNYVNYESAFARAILSDMLIEGNELVDALDNAKLDMEKDSEEYEQLETKYKELEKECERLKEGENYKKLVKNIESLIKGKEGSFVDKIKSVIKESKKI